MACRLRGKLRKGPSSTVQRIQRSFHSTCIVFDENPKTRKEPVTIFPLWLRRESKLASIGTTIPM